MKFDIRRVGAIGVTAAALAVTGCGGEDEEATPAATPSPTATQSPAAESTAPAEDTAGETSEELQVDAAEPEPGKYAFTPSDLQAKSGSVTITMRNPQANKAPHNVAIEGSGVNEQGEVVTPGADSKVSAELEPGEYTFYCGVGDHRENGMEGTLTVE